MATVLVVTSGKDGIGKKTSKEAIEATIAKQNKKVYIIEIS